MTEPEPMSEPEEEPTQFYGGIMWTAPDSFLSIQGGEPFETIVKFRVDGTVEVNPKYDTDAAAHVIWDAVRKLARPSPEGEPVAWQWRPTDSKHWMTEQFEETARYRAEQSGGGDVRQLYTRSALAPVPSPEPDIEGLVARLRDRERLVMEGYIPLVRACEDAASALSKLADRARELEGENERMKGHIEELDDQCSELDTQLDAWGQQLRAAESERDLLTAEVGRLRSQLERTADLAIPAYAGDGPLAAIERYREQLRILVRAALNPQKGVRE